MSTISYTPSVMHFRISRPLVSSSFNEDVVLPRRPESSVLGKHGGGGICIYRRDGNVAKGGGSAKDDCILFVCESGKNRVVAIDATSGAFIRTVYGNSNDEGSRSIFDQFFYPQRPENLLNNPQGICLLAPSNTITCNNSDDHPLLFIADSDNHRIQVVNSGTGELVGSIGGNPKGVGDGEFYSPIGVCIGPSTCRSTDDPLLFVSDFENRRVQVFNAKTLAYVRTFRRGPFKLRCPYGICIGGVISPTDTDISSYSTEYNVIVASNDDSDISVFNAASGSFIKKIGLYGKGPRQLNGPMGVYYLPAGARSSNPNGDPHIYVADYSNNRVAIFNANTGAHVRHIDVDGGLRFILPATTSDGDSFLYISTYRGIKIISENNYFLVFQFLYLLNHKTFDDFVFNLDYELREELVESLKLEFMISS